MRRRASLTCAVRLRGTEKAAANNRAAGARRRSGASNPLTSTSKNTLFCRQNVQRGDLPENVLEPRTAARPPGHTSLHPPVGAMGQGPKLRSLLALMRRTGALRAEASVGEKTLVAPLWWKLRPMLE